MHFSSWEISWSFSEPLFLDVVLAPVPGRPTIGFHRRYEQMDSVAPDNGQMLSMFLVTS